MDVQASHQDDCPIFYPKRRRYHTDFCPVQQLKQNDSKNHSYQEWDAAWANCDCISDDDCDCVTSIERSYHVEYLSDKEFYNKETGLVGWLSKNIWGSEEQETT